MPDAVTSSSPRCADCGLPVVPRTDPLEVLRRLPAELFNLAPPIQDTFLGSQWDEEVIAGAGDGASGAIFGVVPGIGVTLQYDLARILAQEKDAFRAKWAEAQALQLALGRMEVVDGKVHGQCPRARGADLDRLGAQFGVGRPPGFTDCCYWRLVRLVAFQRGGTALLLVEIAELFTGIRPAVLEVPAKITLHWPGPSPEEPGGTAPGWQFFDHQGFVDTALIGRPGGTFWAGGTIAPAPTNDYDGFWSTGGDSAAGDYFWADTARPCAPTLRDVLEQVKPAGVALILEHVPRQGAIGCSGATRRGGEASRGFWR